MIKTSSVVLALALAGTVSAQGTVQISLGIRETGAAGGSDPGIGGNGGSSGSIEWVNLDGQTLTLDGTWQKFTFNMTTDPLTGFTGDGVLDGDFGTIEHIRILNAAGVTDPIQLWIDDVSNTVTPMMGGPTTTTFGVFEGFADGDEVMFQEPSFSGSTGGNITGVDTSGVDNFVASRTSSCRVEFSFVDNSATRWLRLTTFNTANQANPVVRFDDNSVVEFYMRGGECQPNLGSQGPGTPIAEFCGVGLNANENSTYYVRDASPTTAGAILISNAGMADLPILGGNLVSGAGFAGAVPFTTDGNGAYKLPCGGHPKMFSLVLQSLILDRSAPFQVAFTNAVQGNYGQ